MAAPSKEQYSRSIGCPTTNHVTVICKNSKQQYLALNGSAPSYHLTHKDKYAQYEMDGNIAQKVSELCGVHIVIRGILRIEHTENNGLDASMRCIYYAELDETQKSNTLTKNAQWMDKPSKQEITAKLETNALFAWINYLEIERGVIYPLNVFTIEGEGVSIPDYSMKQIQNHEANIVNVYMYKQMQSNKTDADVENEQKTQ